MTAGTHTHTHIEVISVALHIWHLLGAQTFIVTATYNTGGAMAYCAMLA